MVWLKPDILVDSQFSYRSNSHPLVLKDSRHDTIVVRVLHIGIVGPATRQKFLYILKVANEERIGM